MITQNPFCEAESAIVGGETAEADLALCRTAAEGNAQARRRLVNRLYDRVRNTVRFLACGHEGEEDFVQAAIVQILLSFGNYKAISSLEAWADRITVRTVMRDLKSARKSKHVLLAEPMLSQNPQISADTEIDVRQINARIAAHLTKLKSAHAEALTLHLGLGYSILETARMTDTKIETMRDRLKVARKKFGKMIARDTVLAEWADKKGV